MKAKQPAVEAVRLLGKWRRVATGHVAFGTGCACGAATIGVQVQDYEQDILGFLRGRHGTAASSIAELLTGVARTATKADLAMLADLERSLDSFETLHRGKRAS